MSRKGILNKWHIHLNASVLLHNTLYPRGKKKKIWQALPVFFSNGKVNASIML